MSDGTILDMLGERKNGRTGSYDHHDPYLARIADALERIATKLEEPSNE